MEIVILILKEIEWKINLKLNECIYYYFKFICYYTIFSMIY